MNIFDINVNIVYVIASVVIIAAFVYMIVLTEKQKKVQ